MQKYRRMLRRRATFLLIDWLVIVIFLTAWIVMRKPVPTERTISYNRASDHILVQLGKLPEHPRAQMHTVQMWTLYGVCIPCSMPPTQAAPLTMGSDGIACLPMCSLLPGNTYLWEHAPATVR